MKAFLGMLLALTFTVLLAAGPAVADTILFSDSFTTENSGNSAQNYTAFANWNITNGTVDLLSGGALNLGLLCTGAGGDGVCVDLDGSTFDAGIMTTKTSFSFLAGQTYDLKFDLAGSQRGDINTVQIEIENVPLSSTLITVQSADPFSTRTITVTPLINAMGTISFENVTGSINNPNGDNEGALLDNVVLSQHADQVVPEPAGISLLATGLIALFAFRRRLGRRAGCTRS
jgi:hypothetical protein